MPDLMSRLRWRKVMRDVRLHWPRTILVVLAIVVGLAGAGSVLDTWALMQQVTREEYRASHPASATLRVDSVSAEVVARVRALPAIAAARARRTVSGSVRVPGNPVSRSLVVFSLEDFRASGIGHIEREEGTWPPRDGTISIEHSSVAYAGVALSDSVSVRLGDATPLTLTVSGIARDVGLPPGWMEHVVYAFATPSTLARMGAPASFNEVQIAVRDDALDRDAVRRVAFEVKRLFEGEGRVVSNVDVPVPGEHQHAAQINSLLYTQGAFGLIALALSGILVVNLVAAMLVGQVREIGVMKAIGATTGQVAGMYLALALILGLISTAIAIPIAAIVGRAYADFTADILNFSTAGFAIPRWILAVQVGVGLVFPVLAAAIPVSRGCRVSVGAALRDVGIASRIRARRLDAWSTRLVAMSGVSRPLLLSLRNAFRRRQRMALTLLTLATGGAVFIGALNLKQAVRGAVGLLFDAQQYAFALRLSRGWPSDSLERTVAAVNGVTGAEAWGAARATVLHGDSTFGNALPVSAPPPATTMLLHPMVQGRWLRDGDKRAVVVNRRLLLDEPSIHVGDSVSMIVAGRPVTWMVVGVVDIGVQPAAYVARSALAAFLMDDNVDRLLVMTSLRGPAMQLDLMQRVRAALTDRGIAVENGQIMHEQRTVVQDHLLMVAGFLGSMAQLMIVVGGLALASTMGMSVLERTREIGVLRAIGARHGAIFTMVQVEGLVITVLGWALAIPLSLPMSIALGRAFGRIMLPLPERYLPNALGVLEWLGIALVVSFIACAAPAWRAMRVPTRVALAYE